MTHVNLAFGLIQDGTVTLEKLTHLDLLPRFRQWNPDIHIVLSIGGWGAGGFSEMARTEEGRRRFALSCRRAVDVYGLDGIDIDWEYPCSSLAGIDADPSDRENFTLLLRALRDALGDHLLSVAVGASTEFVRSTQMDQVASIVDYVQIMTYDLRSGFSHQAGHHAALGASSGDMTNLNTKDVVEMFHSAGVPLEKTVIGAAFYGRIWKGVRKENNGLLQPAATVGLTGPRYSEIDEDYLNSHRFVQYWDADAQAAYLWNGEEFVSFESVEAVRLKCAFVRERGLLGIMYWEHGCDPSGELLRAIDEALHSPSVRKMHSAKQP
ncbi:MAG: glycoside hydrolase family 18 protein [Candidatus Spyradocola sp.]